MNNIDNKINFLGYPIDLSKRVLSPRPETEFWVKKAISRTKKKKGLNMSIKILDLFCGSGCIGIAFLKEFPKAHCIFGDISQNALSQTEINLKLNQIESVKYQLVRTDIFSKVKGKFDLILANPPYVAAERLNEVAREVKEYEPKQAWFGGSRGMRYIKKFLQQAQDFLKPDTDIYLEFDPQQRIEIGQIALKRGYQINFFRDQFNQWRWAILRPKNLCSELKNS